MKRILLSFIACLGIFVYADNDQSTNHIEKIVLGSGCFWGAEKGYEALEGVIDAVSGYADGEGVRPNYREITKFTNKFNPNNHAEVVEVTFNKNLISIEDLMIHYLESHDPTQFNRQGNDIGTQYRSIVLFSNNSQKQKILELIAEYQIQLNEKGYGQIRTAVKPLKKFFKAENYHQDYIKKNPNGYCPDHSTGVRFVRNIAEPKNDNSKLKVGKNIVVIEPNGYCPYCDKFREDVLNEYAGNIPLHYRKASELEGINLVTPTWATPTILFIQDGEEVFGYQGYLNQKDFYKALGSFQLGNSEAYRVAFNDGTDARFCKEYEIFKDTPDGVFVDCLLYTSPSPRDAHESRMPSSA